ncbi:mitotic checkpoint family protein [Perilla frutescens var. hirtella]|nr:mitotic checkpoint family protein [Perilla frutescens var. hirtella]
MKSISSRRSADILRIFEKYIKRWIAIAVPFQVAGAGRSATTLIQTATMNCFYVGFATQGNFVEEVAVVLSSKMRAVQYHHELKVGNIFLSFDVFLQNELVQMRSESKLSISRISADLERMECRAKNAKKELTLLSEKLEELKK